LPGYSKASSSLCGLTNHGYDRSHYNCHTGIRFLDFCEINIVFNWQMLNFHEFIY